MPGTRCQEMVVEADTKVVLKRYLDRQMDMQGMKEYGHVKAREFT